MIILIKGLEMPEECSLCPLMSEAGYCNGTNELTTEELESLWRIVGRPSWCPLVEIPPHGRLIDADAMIASIKRQTGFLKIMGGDLATMAEVLEKGILQEIENAPTIIPTDEGE